MLFFSAVRRLLPTLLLLLLISPFGSARAVPPVRLIENQAVPAFNISDVLGRTISTESLRGQRVLLSFMRDVGCPVCELRLARLALRSDSLKAAHTRVVLIYESDNSTLRQYLADKDLPFTFIADPEGALHDAFGVEKSFSKTMLGFANGAGRKIKEGKKLQTQQFNRDEATLTRITADFIIDEELMIRRVYYGRFLGDHLPM